MAESRQGNEPSEPLLLDKYRGCLMGVLLGDCIGGLFDFQWRIDSLPPRRVEQIEDSIWSHLKNYVQPSLQYTDDTSMSLSLAESLLKNCGLDPKDLARTFVDRYLHEVNKQLCYAQVPYDVFDVWEEMHFEGDIFAPARRRFGGVGSTGNGGAMRAAPVALFCGGDPDALVQAYAVSLALHNNAPLDVELFLNQLLEFNRRLEDGLLEKPFTKRFEIVRQLLREDNVEATEVVRQLGHSVLAVDAMPMALFCALRSLKPIASVNREHEIERSIIYAISMGGDTDTIASMTGAITGALFGMKQIPSSWITMCEASEKLLAVAEKLFLHASAKIASSCGSD
ncbi:putative Poly(ADP-ribose) glycohydrolase ARH3 [Hypsibius exemplaris]|uniref:ADP-ribosylhydrolase ARH3 n=1 Tax=Hypsibius exemplaris TaxID=2072580 RepID=A0A1W0XBR3_HYPEX|nr:putative Poly(ADP-ribose) glycohydrolase ARH3 [Hypsibius exemplaris]